VTEGSFYEWKDAVCDDGGANLVTWNFAAPPDAAVVEVPSHGRCDLKCEFDTLARQMGLQPPYYGHGATLDMIDGAILPRNPWAGRWSSEMPSGFFAGASGSTRVWREFYALGERGTPWMFWEPLQPAMHTRTWLDCCGVTWHYNLTTDYETRLVLKVNGWRQSNEDEQRFARYRALADQLAAQVSRWLQAIPPPEVSQQVREGLPARRQGTT
jgi:hypothetical protein